MHRKKTKWLFKAESMIFPSTPDIGACQNPSKGSIFFFFSFFFYYNPAEIYTKGFLKITITDSAHGNLVSAVVVYAPVERRTFESITRPVFDPSR